VKLVLRRAASPSELVAVRQTLRGADPVTAAAEAAELSDRNLFFRRGEAQGFVASIGERHVGRVIASVDAKLGGGVGHFGFFECVEDAEVAGALLQAAEGWLAEHGCRVVHGPVNLHVLRAYRFQVSGFARSPFVGEPRNPSYYPELVQAHGYLPHASWGSWDIARHKLLLWRGMQMLQRRKLQRLRAAGYHLEPMDLERLDAELARLHPLLMDNFSDNYDFSPIPLEEYVQVEQRLALLTDVNASFLLDSAGQLAGFSFGYRSGRAAVLHTFAISREHRGRGLPYLIFEDALSTVGRLGLHSAIGALVKHGPSHYARLGPPHRRYATYVKELSHG
jgi:GNAT superfamily N-acetyltransferase